MIDRPDKVEIWLFEVRLRGVALYICELVITEYILKTELKIINFQPLSTTDKMPVSWPPVRF